MGYSLLETSYEVESPSLSRFVGDNYVGENYYEANNSKTVTGFKIALVPLVNTSKFAHIGKALEYVLGYLGLGDALMASPDEGDSKMRTLVSSLNIALNFAFSSIHWGNFKLGAQALYMRNNFDAAAKADTYGGKVTGLFSRFPFGFTLEGGYKHFSLASYYFSQGYPNGTMYLNSSIYFPFKYLTLGAMYQYDMVYKSRLSIALSSNTFSALGGIPYGGDGYRGGDYGARFRWGGWKAGRK